MGSGAAFSSTRPAVWQSGLEKSSFDFFALSFTQGDLLAAFVFSIRAEDRLCPHGLESLLSDMTSNIVGFVTFFLLQDAWLKGA